MQLKPYQAQILDELRHLPSIALFMGTGTGKTITSLFRFRENPTEKLLVICPHKIITQWEDSINKFDSSLKVLTFPKSASAKTKDAIINQEWQEKDVIIVNFEILHKVISLLTIVDNNWTVIIDESHKIKEPGTKRKPIKVTKMSLSIGILTDYKIILTATPTQKQFGGYIDYYTQLKFLGYMDMSLQEFKRKHVIERDMVLPGRPYPIKTIIGYRDVNKIDDMLKLIARRYISKAGDSEPVHTKIRIDRTSTYTKTKQGMTYKDIIMDNISRKRVGLKTLTSGTITGFNEFQERFTYKDNTSKIDWTKEFLNDTDEAVTIFYQYNIELASLEELMKKIGKNYIIINGKTKDKYNELKKEFDVVLAQYQAGAESLDGLQHKCHIMIFYSMPESSLLYKQAMGRIDRVGQEQVPVYYYLVMDKTIDSQIYTMIEKKVEFSENILDQLLLEEE